MYEQPSHSDEGATELAGTVSLHPEKNSLQTDLYKERKGLSEKTCRWATRLLNSHGTGHGSHDCQLTTCIVDMIIGIQEITQMPQLQMVP